MAVVSPPPKTGGGQYVGFVDGSHFAAPVFGCFAGHPDDALDFRYAVLFRIPGLLHAADHLRLAALAEINAAGQFAHDQDIDAADPFRLQR